MNGSPLPPALLYVEDEENDVFFLQRALTRAEVAVRFQSVCDGGKAIAYLAGEAPYAGRDLPDLVLLDLNLPVHSGFEVLEWLRRQPGLGELPVVVFSSSGRAEDREKARALGASDYLIKPASTLQLVELVRGLDAKWLAPVRRRTV